MFKHLLVPLDGSEYAEEALTAARELSTCFDSDITLLCVVIPVDTLLSMQRGYAASFPEIAALAQYRSEAAREYLHSLRDSLAQQGFRVNVEIVEGAQVAETIVRVAQRLDADTIVMSTHGNGGVRRLMLGSVAERVIRQANVTVILIRVMDDATP